MTTSLTRLVLALGMLLAFASCSRTHSEAGGDSSTHWLRSCKSDDQCGSLACVCGVCSEGCKDDGQCAQFGGKAVCLTGNSDACGPSKLFCDAECSRDEDCGGSALSCESGRCRKLGAGPHEVTGADPPPAAPLDGGAMSVDSGSDASSFDAANTAPDAAAPVVPTPIPDGGAISCAPQRARSSGDECLRVEGYAWDGSRCDEIVCGCEGDDCGSLYPTAQACTAAFQACSSPSTVCSGLPWYQCADHCPSDWSLAGGGRSFGECAGDCSFDLTLTQPSAPAGGSCPGTLTGHLQVKNTTGKPDRYVEFALTPDAFEEAMQLSRATASLALEPVMGCPDCADGGRATIKRSLAGSSEEFAYEFGTYRLPPVLRGVHRFVQQLIDQANVCRGGLLASCVTTTAPFGNNIIEPICGLASPATTPCICTVPFDQLSTLTGTQCDGTCASCSVPDSTCGAKCVQPCASGERKWQVYCTE
jgi:hypothetical protein